MADNNFLQAALELLGRPGNAVRGALIDGPGGFGQGLSGDRHYDPTELPGINQLPDEGLSLGPLHLTPRTVGGFAAGAALDPMSYVGPGLLHGAGRLGELGEGAMPALGRFAADQSGELRIPSAESIMAGVRRSPRTADMGGNADLWDSLAEPQFLDKYRGMVNDIKSDLNDPGAGSRIQLAHDVLRRRYGDNLPEEFAPLFRPSTGGYAGNAQTDPIEQLIEHANSIQPGHALAEVDGSQGTTQAMRPNPPPSAEVTPVGDQKYAQAKDKLGGVQAQLQQKRGDLGNAEDWLGYTSKSDTPTANRWEDVVGVKPGTNPEDPSVLAKQEAEPRDFSLSKPDLSKGPGLTAKYPVNGQEESVGFSRQEVMNHLAGLQAQIEDLSTKLGGQTGSRFGDPLEKRGMENTLSDWQARRQLAADPTLANTQRQELMRTSTSTRPGLSPKQEDLAQRKTGQQLSRDETFRRAPDSQYYNGGSPEAAPDEANMTLAERDGSQQHGDPLEEQRAAKETQDKFGRQGPGTYQSGDNGTQLGVDENRRGAGVGGRGFTEEIHPAKPGDFSRVVTQHIDEPMAGQPPLPRGQEAQAHASNPHLERELEMIRQMVLSQSRPPAPGPFNRFLGR